MSKRCVPLGILLCLGVLILVLFPAQAQAKRKTVRANTIKALEQATKKLEKTGGIIWLGDRTYRLKKSIVIPSILTVYFSVKTLVLFTVK